MCVCVCKDTASTESYTYLHTLARHDALPISTRHRKCRLPPKPAWQNSCRSPDPPFRLDGRHVRLSDSDTNIDHCALHFRFLSTSIIVQLIRDRKSTRMNSCH